MQTPCGGDLGGGEGVPGQTSDPKERTLNNSEAETAGTGVAGESAVHSDDTVLEGQKPADSRGVSK